MHRRNNNNNNEQSAMISSTEPALATKNINNRKLQQQKKTFSLYRLLLLLFLILVFVLMKLLTSSITMKEQQQAVVIAAGKMTTTTTTTTTTTATDGATASGALSKIQSSSSPLDATTTTNNSTTNNNTNNTSTKPILYLHVGPMKTGTTAIQTYLKKVRVFKALSKDNISTMKAYNYKGMQYLMYTCLKHPLNNDTDNTTSSSKCEREDVWENFYTKLKSKANSGQHLLHSVETYAQWPDDNEQAIVKLRSLRELFQIKVMVLYRRPASWLLSMYKQQRKLHMLLTQTRTARWTSYEDDLKCGTVQTINDFVPQGRDTLDTVELFEKVFGKENVYVGNFETSTSLENEFFCNMIPGAFPTVCKLLKKNQRTMKMGRKNNNDIFLYNEDLVVYKAYHRGYFKNSNTDKEEEEEFLSRHNASMKLKEILDDEKNNNEDAIPKICVTNKLKESLWNRTLTMEQRFSSSSSILLSKEEEEESRSKFEDEITKMCHIDAEAFLNQTKWQKILSSCEFQIRGC